MVEGPKYIPQHIGFGNEAGSEKQRFDVRLLRTWISFALRMEEGKKLGPQRSKILWEGKKTTGDAALAAEPVVSYRKQVPLNHPGFGESRAASRSRVLRSACVPSRPSPAACAAA